MVTPRTHCHFTMQASALPVPELGDDHTPPSCLVTNSLAEPRYRSVNTLVLPHPLLTQGGPVIFRACDLAHHGLYCSHVCVCAHHSSLQHLPFCVCLRCPSVPLWMNIRTCGCLLAPQGGSLLLHGHPALRTTLSPAATIWCELPRPLCRNRPPHGSHMVQRLHALCPAHRLHTVSSVHKFRRAPHALSQVTLCQPRSLRLPRSSPLPNS